jgi:hypothetical protein
MNRDPPTRSARVQRFLMSWAYLSPMPNISPTTMISPSAHHSAGHHSAARHSSARHSSARHSTSHHSAGGDQSPSVSSSRSSVIAIVTVLFVLLALGLGGALSLPLPGAWTELAQAKHAASLAEPDRVLCETANVIRLTRGGSQTVSQVDVFVTNVRSA